MKKLKSLFSGKSGKAILIIAAIVIAFLGTRGYYRGVEKTRLIGVLKANNNWGNGLPSGKTWEDLANYLYDTKKANGEYSGKWWA